jgi:hypothetical protein
MVPTVKEVSNLNMTCPRVFFYRRGVFGTSTKILYSQYAANLPQYAANLRQYAANLRQYAANLRQYAANLRRGRSSSYTLTPATPAVSPPPQPGMGWVAVLPTGGQPATPAMPPPLLGLQACQPGRLGAS